MNLKSFILLSFLFFSFTTYCQIPITILSVDSLVGSNHAGRNWWDLQHYTIDIETDIDNKRLSGIVSIKYKVIGSGHVMMIDLQAPMLITKVTSGAKIIPFKQQGRFWWIDKNSEGKVGKIDSIMIEYNGSPKVASNPPWDGGLIWNKDEKGRPYVGTACQGDGASLWWPCKEIQSDEPDMGVDLFFQAPKDLTVVSNGRLLSSTIVDAVKKRWHWRVTQPINNYNVTMNIGQYERIAEIYEGKKGPLDVSFYVLDYNLEKGMELFPEIKLMLECFESRIGPYPFYEDGYKMIETSFLGMEHQSGIAYGNKFKRGYSGRDRSNSGYGLLWDFILVHESGHEWFGNSITSKDINDSWIHEGFTTYLETVYTECLSGKEAAEKYVIGQRKIITNKKPLINQYGVNFDAPGDIYDKGASLIHTIRTIMDDDEKFFAMLQNICKKYYHSSVSSDELEAYMIKESKLNLKPIFEQYLRHTDIPTLHYTIQDDVMTLAWTKVIPDFKMPVLLVTKQGNRKWITASDKPVSFRLNGDFDHWDENIYCEYKLVE